MRTAPTAPINLDRNPPQMDGRITICKGSSPNGDVVRIYLTDGASRVRFLDVQMTQEAFCAALFGLGEVPVTFLTRGLALVGATEERCEVPVTVLDGSWDTRDERAQAAVDVSAARLNAEPPTANVVVITPWVGDAENATNMHCRIATHEHAATYKVHFHRFVRPVVTSPEPG